MSSTTIIAIIAVLIITSFTVSAISYSRQQALKKRNQLVKEFQQQADEVLAHIHVLLRVDNKYDLIIQLQKLAVHSLSSAVALNPASKRMQNILATEKARLNEYKESRRSVEVVHWLKSATELTATQTSLAQISKLLDVYRNKGTIKSPVYQELQDHLNDLKQTLSLNTYLYQADTYGEQNNITSYQLNIKQAIQIIKKLNIDSTVKNQKIKDLSERIQEVKRTGKTNGFTNLIKPSAALETDKPAQNLG